MKLITIYIRSTRHGDIFKVLGSILRSQTTFFWKCTFPVKAYRSPVCRQSCYDFVSYAIIIASIWWHPKTVHTSRNRRNRHSAHTSHCYRYDARMQQSANL